MVTNSGHELDNQGVFSDDPKSLSYVPADLRSQVTVGQEIDLLPDTEQIWHLPCLPWAKLNPSIGKHDFLKDRNYMGFPESCVASKVVSGKILLALLPRGESVPGLVNAF